MKRWTNALTKDDLEATQKILETAFEAGGKDKSGEPGHLTCDDKKQISLEYADYLR